MENKLTIKHLSQYLPYGLMFEDLKGGVHKLMSLDLQFANFCWGKATLIQETVPLLVPICCISDEVLKEFSIGFRMYYSNDKFNYGLMNVNDYEIALENHIDIFGLINKGLAKAIYK